MHIPNDMWTSSSLLHFYCYCLSSFLKMCRVHSSIRVKKQRQLWTHRFAMAAVNEWISSRTIKTICIIDSWILLHSRKCQKVCDRRHPREVWVEWLHLIKFYFPLSDACYCHCSLSRHFAPYSMWNRVRLSRATQRKVRWTELSHCIRMCCRCLAWNAARRTLNACMDFVCCQFLELSSCTRSSLGVLVRTWTMTSSRRFSTPILPRWYRRLTSLSILSFS